MPNLPRKHDPAAPLRAAGVPVHKPSRQQRRFLHTGSKQWRAIREQVLAREPLCRDCSALGYVTPANEVDHQDNQTANNTPENLAPLCKPCHSRRTAAREAGTLLKGCDINGIPLDPRHPWNQAKNRQRDESAGTSPKSSFIAKADDK